MEYSKVIELVKGDDCKDYVMSLDDVNLGVGIDTIEMGFKNKKYTLTQGAKRHILDRLSIPVVYFNKCPDYMQKDQLEYWQDVATSRWMYIRTCGDSVRAVMSDKYKKYDNYDFLQDIKDTLDTHGILFDTAYEMFNADQMNVGIPLYKMNEWSSGIMFQNSEVASTAITAYKYLHNADIGYGIILEQLSRLGHTGKGREQVGKKLEEAVFNVLVLKDEPIKDYLDLLEYKDIDVEGELNEIGIPVYMQVKVMNDLDKQRHSAYNLTLALLSLLPEYKEEGQIKMMRDIGRWVKEWQN